MMVHRKGAMLILVTAVLVILLIGAVFTIDVAYMQLVRAELRTASDAAAQAGSEALARTQDPNVAIARAIEVASANGVAGQPLTIDPADVEIGGIRVNGNGRFSFDTNSRPLAAVRVRGGRTVNDADGSVPLFFARLFNTNSFQPEASATAAANVRDVALVLDVSGSMGSSSGGITRIDALKAAVNIFLSEIQLLSPGTLISLSTYSTTATKRIDLTDDYAAIRTRVQQFNASGLTAIGLGLRMGSDSLEFDSLNRPFAHKTIVLMTDGQHNRGVSPLTVVNEARARRQVVHTVTFGAGADISLMQQVAAATVGGTHVHADGSADLAEAFRDIARTLSVTLIE